MNGATTLDRPAAPPPGEAAAPPPIVTFRGVSKSYDGLARVVHSLDLDIARGEFLTLLGPSGSGKTTSLMMLAGFEAPSEGDITLNGRSLASVPPHRRNIGMVFQSYALFPHLTVAGNLAYPLRMRHLPKSEIAPRVARALDMVRLGAFAGRQPASLSGGQQQRVALARAIVRQPRLLLLDEPLSNLDAALRDDMRSELKRLQQQIGVTTIYVTHDQSEALDMSDQIAVIKDGRIVQMAPPREIYVRPSNTFVASFVGATNLLRGAIEPSAGALASMRLADGQMLRCLSSDSHAAVLPAAVSVRPEAITLTTADSPPRDGCNALDGVVIAAGFQGHMNRYRIQAAGQVLQANSGPETVFPVGAPVRLQFPFESTIAVPD